MTTAFGQRRTAGVRRDNLTWYARQEANRKARAEGRAPVPIWKQEALLLLVEPTTPRVKGASMGQCIYVAEMPKRRGTTETEIVTREMPSELWMSPAAAGAVLAEGHMLNTTIGVWFYESDVLDKEALRVKLLALVDHVTAPGYLAERRVLGMKAVVTKSTTKKRRAR